MNANAGRHSSQPSPILIRTISPASIKSERPPEDSHSAGGQLNPTNKPTPASTSRTPVKILSRSKPNRLNSPCIDNELKHNPP